MKRYIRNLEYKRDTVKYNFKIKKIFFSAEMKKNNLFSLEIITLNEYNRENDVSTSFIKPVKEFLRLYMAGFYKNIYDKIKINFSGTPKTAAVLRELMSIPFGETISYGELADRCGLKNGARFIGNVMAGNRIILLIPCHRVIKADGSIGGYSGGLYYKRKFLKIERR